MTLDAIPGTEVAGYRIESVIGRGGMGVVYLAEHIRLKRKVALKVLAPELVRDEGFRERFVRESELAASLEHQNVVPVHDAGEAEGLLFIAMRFVEGTDLKTLIQREETLDPDQTASLISQIASALDAAHSQGLIHRDVKPANVLIDEAGHAYLTDFGLTKRADQGQGFTRTGQFMGSVDYAAPEQFEGQPLDPRTDVYSLAATAYECLTGSVPFPRDQEAATMFAHLKTPPPRVSDTRPDLPPELDHVVSRGLAKKPEDRFTTAGSFGAAMTSALAPADRARGARAPVERPELRPANLPVPRSSFIGRARETAEVRDLLTRHRLVTLTGAGGSGKTRLAIEVAERERQRFPGGPWWLDLAPLIEADAVSRAASSMLGLSEEYGRPPIEVVAEAIGAGEALLLVDNCEHLLDEAAAFVKELLAACPGLHMLATSRQALGVLDERAFRVPSLTVPASSEALGSLAEQESVKLFVDRARTALPGFELTAENGPAVAGICRRLDGMPLPIELAAARVAVLTPKQIDARLDDHIGMLSGDDRTALPRQRTLRALVDWSHDLLSETEQLLFRRLAVFSGGFSLEAAEGVCSSRGIEPVDVLDLLTQLVDKSLVMVDRDPDRARYRMLETVRAFALERLRDSSEQADVRAAHLRFFADLVEQFEPELVGPSQNEAGRRLTTEIDNLRTAVEWSLAGGDVEAGLRLVGVRRLWQFAQSHLGEGRSWIERLLATATNPPHPLRASAVHAAGWISWLQGDQEGARAYLEESLSIRRTLGDASATGLSLYMLALVEKDGGDYERARAHTEEALDLARGIGDRQQVADLLGLLGQIAYDQGTPDSARTLAEESAELAQEVGDKHGLADALRILGWIAHDSGDATTAGRRFEQALALQRELEDRACSSITLMALGSLAGSHGDRHQALAFFAEALSLQRDLGQRARIADILWQLGAAALDREPRAAARLFGASEALRKRLGVPLRNVYDLWYEREVSKLRQGLGEELFLRSLDEGRALMWREAIEEALRLTARAAES